MGALVGLRAGGLNVEEGGGIGVDAGVVAVLAVVEKEGHGGSGSVGVGGLGGIAGREGERGQLVAITPTQDAHFERDGRSGMGFPRSQSHCLSSGGHTAWLL